MRKRDGGCKPISTTATKTCGLHCHGSGYPGGQVEGLGRLQSVDLRSQWKNESQDFTPWLAQPENLTLLAEAIGIELELDQCEKPVGPYSADILCKEAGNNGWVVIENQLAPTDHSHLGQILTYAAGLDATTVVWVAQRFTDEHRAAIQWLNDHTDERLSFFGVEVELWRIGSSICAPKFNVVGQPNDWSKSVQASVRTIDLTDAKKTQLDFWTAYREFLTAKSTLRCQKAAPQHWVNTAIGRSGAHLSSIASTWDSEAESYSGELRVELYLDGMNAKLFFQQLILDKEAIEKEIGAPLTWHNPLNVRSCRIFARQPSDITDRSKWPEQHEWLRVHLEAFYRVFSPRVKALKVDSELVPTS
jgi:uncharacterized protein DUF4268